MRANFAGSLAFRGRIPVAPQTPSTGGTNGGTGGTNGGTGGNGTGGTNGGGDCNFNFSYDDDITINADGTFGVTDWTPAPGFSPTFSFSGTINGSSASGTASGTNIPVINNCSFNWMATQSQ